MLAQAGIGLNAVNHASMVGSAQLQHVVSRPPWSMVPGRRCTMALAGDHPRFPSQLHGELWRLDPAAKHAPRPIEQQAPLCKGAPNP